MKKPNLLKGIFNCERELRVRNGGRRLCKIEMLSGGTDGCLVSLVESGVVELLVFYDFEMPNRFGIFVTSAVRRLAMVIGQIE